MIKEERSRWLWPNVAVEADLEVQAAVKVLLDVLLQDNAGGESRLQGDGHRDGFGGAVDVGAQGLLLPSCDLRAHSHSENPAGGQRKRRLAGGVSACGSVATAPRFITSVVDRKTKGQ